MRKVVRIAGPACLDPVHPEVPVLVRDGSCAFKVLPKHEYSCERPPNGRLTKVIGWSPQLTLAGAVVPAVVVGS